MSEKGIAYRNVGSFLHSSNLVAESPYTSSHSKVHASHVSQLCILWCTQFAWSAQAYAPRTLPELTLQAPSHTYPDARTCCSPAFQDRWMCGHPASP